LLMTAAVLRAASSRCRPSIRLPSYARSDRRLVAAARAYGRAAIEASTTWCSPASRRSWGFAARRPPTSCP
jgi:hypothetical protein